MFTVRAHVLLQLLACFLQVVVPTIPVIPPEWQHTSAALVAFLQMAMALLAQYRNPNGTPASEPYQKSTPPAQ